MKALSYGLLMGLALVAASAAKVDYTGHMVIRVFPETKEQVDFLLDWESTGSIELLATSAGPNGFTDIRVSPATYYRVAHLLRMKNLNHKVQISDLGRLQYLEQRSILLRRAIHNGKALDLTNYHPYEEVMAHLNDVASTSPLASTAVVGTTGEGRDIVQISISTDPSAGKQIVWFECNIHAREWITSATCLWIIDQLTNGYGNDAEITALVDQYDWKFVPIANPDGYVYTWTTDRLWRKNRVENSGSACRGVDVNRNFPVGFGGLGSSDLPCSDTYHGVSAFSEKESAALRDLIAADRGRVKAAISVHSYSQLWLSPRGWTSSLPPEYDEMYRVMGIGVDALTATFGTRYTYGNSADTIYVAAGITTDHYYENEGVVHSYTLELRDTGTYGFVLPPEQIVPTATETWNGLKAFVNAI